MQTITGTTFSDTTVELDGKQFSDCIFTRCKIVFRATESFGLEGCGFHDCGWLLDGPARLTVAFLQGMYHGVDGGEKYVEQVFAAVRSGTFS